MPTLSGLILLAALLPVGTEALDRGERALAAFRVEESIKLLEQARRGGPYQLADHARLYEQLAIAHAYLDHKAAALEAFDLLLALDPARVIRYTLSPRVTLLFEEARRRTEGRPGTQVELHWPPDRTVADPIPLLIEVLANRRGLLRSAAVFWRGHDLGPFQRQEVALRAGAARVVLPAVARGLQRPIALDLYLVGYDQRGNEVYRWHDARRPREIALKYLPRQPWYKKWWVWAIAGGVLAAGASVATVAATWEPSSRIEATGRVVR